MASEEKKNNKGLFKRLKEQLSKTKSSLIERLKNVILSRGRIDDETVEQLEEILLQSDVGVETTHKIVQLVREKVTQTQANSPDEINDALKETLYEILDKDERNLALNDRKPTVFLVVGVNGTGKTTTIGKIGKQFVDDGKKVLLVAGDTFRAAGIEQLEVWAQRSGSDIIKQQMGSDPAAICFDALQAALARETDLVIIDTAGRQHTKINLMEELKKIVRVVRKVIPDAPDEVLLVLDATTGQNALSQAKIFGEAVDVTGIITTKLDGTAKGGIIISIRDKYDIPVMKIGIGEQVDDLRDFNAREFVQALFED